MPGIRLLRVGVWRINSDSCCAFVNYCGFAGDDLPGSATFHHPTLLPGEGEGNEDFDG